MATDPPTRVFLSYSRKDLALAQHLAGRLAAEGFAPFLDLDDIVKGEPWKDRLRELIRSAEAILFLVSPDSVKSSVCDWEINEAELLGKRIFPVVVRPTEGDDIPGRLQRLNYTYLDGTHDEAIEHQKLLAALREDTAWLREGTRLLQLAVRWSDADRPDRWLLRGQDIEGAERWRDTRPPAVPLPEVCLDYIAASRRNASKVQRKWIAGLSLVSVAVALLAGGAIWQWRRAVDQQLTAESNELSLRSDSQRAVAPEEALQLALEAYDRKPTAIAMGAVRHSADLSALLQVRRGFTRWSLPPNGKLIAGSDAFGQIVVLEAEDLRERMRLTPPRSQLTGLAISKSGRFLAGTAGGESLVVWNLEAGTKALETTVPHAISSLKIGEAERIIAAIGDDTITFIELQGLRVLSTVLHSVFGANQVELSPYDRQALVVGKYNKGWIVDPRSGRDLVELDMTGEAAALKPSLGGSEASVLARGYFSRDGKSVLTIGDHRLWRQWDAATGRVIGEALSMDGSGTAWALQLPDGDTLVMEDGSSGRIVWGSLGEQSLSRQLDAESHENLIRAAALSADGTDLATIGSDQVLIIWSTSTYRPKAVFRSPQLLAVESASFTPGGKRLLTASRDGSIALWNASMVSFTGQLPEPYRGVASFSSDGRRLATRGPDGSVIVWALPDLRQISELKGIRGGVQQIAVSRDGRGVAAVGEDGTVQAWDTSTRRATARHAGKFVSSTFDPTGTLIAANDYKGRVLVFKASDGSVVSEESFDQSLTNTVTFSPQGDSYVATGNDGTAVIAATATGKTKAILRLPGKPCRDAVFSPEGRMLITTHDDHVLRKWDVTTGEVVVEFRGHTSTPHRPSVLAGGAVVVSVGDDGLKVWSSDGALMRSLSTYDEIVLDAAFAPGTASLFSVDYDGRVLRYDCSACLEDSRMLAKARHRPTGE